MITAICEMQDQDCGIEDVRLIENTPEAIKEYEDDMEEQMGLCGFHVYFFNTEYLAVNDWIERDVYAFMRLNEHLEIDA